MPNNDTYFTKDLSWPLPTLSKYCTSKHFLCSCTQDLWFGSMGGDLINVFLVPFLFIPAHNLLTSKMVPLKWKHVEIKLLCQKTPLRAQSQLLPTNTPASTLWSARLSDNSPQNLLSWSFIILPQPNSGSPSIFGSHCEVGFCLLHFDFVWCAFLTQHAHCCV